MNLPTMAPVWLLIVIAVILFIVAANSVRVVRPWEKGVVERLGRYMRTAGSGVTIIIPFLDSLQKVDMREQVVDVPPQEVITKDNVVVTVDAVVYYEATDPVKVKYNIANFYLAATKLAQTNLRNVVGEMALDESLTSREMINTKLRQILDEATDKWGTRVVRVEIQRIEPPNDVTQAMHRQMKAERERRATILEAEGQRQAAIEKATGERQAQILRAEGEATAIKTVADATKYREIAVAEGQARAIESVYGSIHKGDPTNDLIAIKYLETLQAIANGQATKIFLPLEASGVLSSIGGVAELFRAGGPPGGGKGGGGSAGAGGDVPGSTARGGSGRDGEA
jgi:regulator of protease activity HflC (stomatin/prohibitin superfamily)